MSVEPIRIDLEEFCTRFTTALDPFELALLNGTRSLRKAMDRPSIQPVLSNLQDNQHRLKILLDKARQQNTYLVIFGPLKSGKSTLMNAVSGAYVSEVTSLPAYPCLVYVRQGESRGFSTTAFNGDSTEYASREQLLGTLEAAHEELAKRIRKADQDNQPFNPVTDFDSAIRRIDFTMPAPYLRESGTILVDTPGLYTKMRYDYGRLTRDFRDTAACAVFVVKTDNLFFEQVFEEFTDLLKVFSRVFLVVNIDSSKQDLGPDGKLAPALEQQDPGRIVQAFENLTMSSEIRTAIDEGRLRIYTIDLLQTAARSLQGDGGEPEAAPPDTQDTPDDAEPEEESDETSEWSPEAEDEDEGETDAVQVTSVAGSQIGFDAFLGDLTDYLNSSEYLIEFMGDSFRQAVSIASEVKSQLAGREIVAFRGKIDDLKKRLDQTEQQLADANILRAHHWEKSLEKPTREIRQRASEHTAGVLPELKARLHEEVGLWKETDESVSDLLAGRVLPKVRKACTASRKRTAELMDGVFAARDGGLDMNVETVKQIQGVGLSLSDIYPEFKQVVHDRFHSAPELPDASPDLQDALPLRKRFVDWLLFRTKARLRMRILGEGNPSKKSIPMAVKAKRIDEAITRDLCDAIDAYCEKTFETALEDELGNLSSEYLEFFQKHVHERLDAKTETLQGECKQLGSQHKVQHRVIESLNDLVTACDTLNDKVVYLRKEFVTDKAIINLLDDGDRMDEAPDDEDLDDEDLEDADLDDSDTGFTSRAQ